MNKSPKFFNALAVVGFAFLGLGCQPASVDRAKVQIRIPTEAEFKKSGKVSAQAAVDYNLLCFAVNVTGGVIPSKNPQCDAAKGAISGSVEAGGLLEVDVLFGENITFEVFGLLRSQSTEACPQVTIEGWNWPLKKIYSLGKTAGVKVSLPDQVVTVNVSMPDTTEHLFAELGLPASCSPSTNPGGPSLGRVGSGAIVQTGTAFKVYSRVSYKNDVKTLEGTQFSIRQWKTGESP